MAEDKPIDVTDQGLFELAEETVGPRRQTVKPQDHESEIRFMFARFCRIRERTKEVCNRPVRIWSHQKGQWWKPNSSGYTNRKEGAGLYDREEADQDRPYSALTGRPT